MEADSMERVLDLFQSQNTINLKILKCLIETTKFIEGRTPNMPLDELQSLLDLSSAQNEYIEELMKSQPGAKDDEPSV